MHEVHEIGTAELFDLHGEGGGLHIIDVRSPAEFAAVHAAPARNVPLDKLSGGDVTRLIGVDTTEPVYLICKSGRRSAAACSLLLEAGFEHVYNVVGGTDEWIVKGLPVFNAG